MSIETIKAFCNGAGVVRLANEVPPGHILILQGPSILLAQAVDALCDESFDGGYQIPGVEHTETLGQMARCILDFQFLVQKRMLQALQIKAAVRDANPSPQGILFDAAGDHHVSASA